MEANVSLRWVKAGSDMDMRQSSSQSANAALHLTHDILGQTHVSFQSPTYRFAVDGGNSVGEIAGHSKAIRAVCMRSSRPYRAVYVLNAFILS